MSTQFFVTHDYINEMDSTYVGVSSLDARNLIYVFDPVRSMEMYYNYLAFTSHLYNRSRPMCKGVPTPAMYMIQLGFIPVVFPPSFWDDWAHITIVPKLRESGLPYYTRPASSIIPTRYEGNYPDLWVSKLDAAAFCKCAPEEVTVKGVLTRCGL